jgi:hypothetical protein
LPQLQLKIMKHKIRMGFFNHPFKNEDRMQL